VLLVHNHYQRPGGEDQVFAAEAELLQDHGHRVVRFVVHNDRIREMSRLRVAAGTVWSGAAYRELRAVIRAERPAVAHFHNTFPLLSPAVYYAARAEGVPVVQTLHNFRLLCPNALFFRSGRTCEDCLGRAVPWPAVRYGCYRGSRAGSAVVAGMVAVHRALRTWSRTVDAYIALSEFARATLVRGGLPAQKIWVKPNFVRRDPGVGSHGGGHALFVGRLSAEKGVETLLSAWDRLGGRIPLVIAGDGPLAGAVAEAARRSGGSVRWVGQQSGEAILGLMKDAGALVLPSLVYENFPMVIAEAFSTGLPVIASDTGSVASLIDHGVTGLHFRTGDPADLAATVQRAWSMPELLAEMGRRARAAYEDNFTAERNYRMLMQIYARVGVGALARSRRINSPESSSVSSTPRGTP
jgi:glycosyltransferase involved in cell wall biosynthesis